MNPSPSTLLGHRLRLWWAVLLKEWREVSRDRRTLHFMVTVPLVFYPLMTLGVAYWQAHELSRPTPPEPEIIIAFDPPAGPEAVRGFLLTQGLTVGSAEDADAIVNLSAEFQAHLTAGQPAAVHITQADQRAYEKVTAALKTYSTHIVEERVKQAGLARDTLYPITVTGQPEAPSPGQLDPTADLMGSLTAGICAYFLIFLTFTGSLAPAVDLAAGEKERGTLETLLASPADRRVLFLGKLIIVMLCGLVSALLTLLGQLIATSLVGWSQGWMTQQLAELLHWDRVLLILGLMLLFSAASAAWMLYFSFKARSAREAHQRLSPLMMLVTFAALGGVSGTVPWHTGTAMIPVVNAALAVTHILNGDGDPTLTAVTALSLLALSWIAVHLCARTLREEGTLFRR
jgi:sodium transport system permease protein